MKTAVVLKSASWLDVKFVFAKKFGTVISKLHKKRGTVMTMAIEDDDTLDEYSIQFFRTAEAGYHRKDLTLGDVFLFTLVFLINGS